MMTDIAQAGVMQRIVLAARPNGKPTPEDFRLETLPIPPCPKGGLLVASQFLSLDPYMRGRMDDRKSYAKPVGLGEPMTGEGVGEIIASDHPAYAVGDLVLAPTGWCSHLASDGTGVRKLDPSLAPISTALGVLGMPGFTAWSGLNLIGKPKAGETLVVAAASGPVGSLVGQLAKMAGCRVVGIAGGPDKVAYLTGKLGFDAALDHRAPGLPEALAAACPDGIDIYFENVGGPIWQAVRPLLNLYARVPVCGLISQYSGIEEKPNQLAATMRDVLTKSLTLRGFINVEFVAHYPDFLREVGAGLAEGRITYREHVSEGLAAMPEAFIGMLEGRNFGKALVRIV